MKIQAIYIVKSKDLFGINTCLSTSLPIYLFTPLSSRIYLYVLAYLALPYLPKLKISTSTSSRHIPLQVQDKVYLIKVKLTSSTS